MRYVILLMLFASCSTTTKYRPTVYGHDYIYGEIITPITHERISCTEESFNEYVSVDLDDLAKLTLVLKNAKLPAHIRIMLEKFDKDLKKIKKKQK